MIGYIKNNLCELCLSNDLPFKAKRLHWGNGSYITITRYDLEDSKKEKYFNVYGIVPEHKRKVLSRFIKQDLDKEILIANSGVYAWKVV